MQKHRGRASKQRNSQGRVIPIALCTLTVVLAAWGLVYIGSLLTDGPNTAIVPNSAPLEAINVNIYETSIVDSVSSNGKGVSDDSPLPSHSISSDIRNGKIDKTFVVEGSSWEAPIHGKTTEDTKTLSSIDETRGPSGLASVLSLMLLAAYHLLMTLYTIFVLVPWAAIKLLGQVLQSILVFARRIVLEAVAHIPGAATYGLAASFVGLVVLRGLQLILFEHRQGVGAIHKEHSDSIRQTAIYHGRAVVDGFSNATQQLAFDIERISERHVRQNAIGMASAGRELEALSRRHARRMGRSMTSALTATEVYNRSYAAGIQYPNRLALPSNEAATAHELRLVKIQRRNAQIGLGTSAIGVVGAAAGLAAACTVM